MGARISSWDFESIVKGTVFSPKAHNVTLSQARRRTPASVRGKLEAAAGTIGTWIGPEAVGRGGAQKKGIVYYRMNFYAIAYGNNALND